MITQVTSLPAPTTTTIDWTKLPPGDAFEGSVAEYTGVFLRIPSGLVLLDKTLRNWITSSRVGIVEQAEVIRMVNIEFAVRAV